MDSYLERLRKELDRATGEASASAMTQAPAGKWTPAQILEHLFLTYKGTNSGLAKCMEQGSTLASRPTLKDALRYSVGRELQAYPGRPQSAGTGYAARNAGRRPSASDYGRAAEDEFQPR